MIGPADLSRTPPFTGSPCARRSEHSFPRRSPRVPHCPAIPLHGRTTRSSSASNCSHRTTTPRPACRTAPPRPRSYCVPPSPAHPCTGSRCAGRCEHTSPSNPRVPHRPAIPLRAQPPAHAGLPAVLAVRRLLGLPVVRPPCFGSPAVLRSAVPCTPCTGWRCVCGVRAQFPQRSLRRDARAANPPWVLRSNRRTPQCTGSRCARRCEHSPQQSPMCHIALRSCSVPEPPARAGLTTALAVRRLLGLTVVLRLRARCGAVPQTALRLRPCGSPVVLRSPFPRAFPVVLLPGPHPPGAVGLLSSGAAPERHRRSVLLPVAW